MVIALDLGVCALATWIAYWLRLGEWELFTPRVLIFGAIAIAVWAMVSGWTRTYRTVTRFSGRHTIYGLMRACVLMSLVLAAILTLARIDSVPRTLAVIHPMLLFLGLIGERLAIARLIAGVLHDARRVAAPKRVLLFGAGASGQQLAASMDREPGFKVVGFVDHNPALRDNVLDGKPIWHSDDVELVLGIERIDEVFVALPSARRSVRRAIVDRIRRADGQVRVRVLPTLSQIASGRVSVSDLREVQIEELLGRDEIPPVPDLMARNIQGKKVLVTGAGGSIGSELCRQILREGPSQLVLAEASEHALYEIDLELREQAASAKGGPDLHPELVNVADEAQCMRLLTRYRPDTLFHAAAYKHVPLVELNPMAGIRNNVLGTLNLCLAAEAAGVSDFILISSDKAVRPTNVMGASKRLCELIVQARAAAQSGTNYSSVRFGNVLGSSGSVVPRFRAQIGAGGPVTITHRDATRYFMTIAEAAQLVIQAGALAGQGEVLLLEMGEPVRVRDMARLMIELSGLTVLDAEHPDGEIAIEEIGLRPGEKLIEELLIDAKSEGTAHPRIIKANEGLIPWAVLERQLRRLKSGLAEADAPGVIALLAELVPEYRPEPERRAPPSETRAPHLRLAK
jgi:FlaA1/EpsC-like NDP-sugar epimerase